MDSLAGTSAKHAGVELGRRHRSKALAARRVGESTLLSLVALVAALAILFAAAPTPASPPARARAGTEGTRTSLLMRERSLGAMGTSLEIRALGPDAAALDAAIGRAIAEMRRIEDLTTDWRPSPLTRLNDAAGTGPIAVPAELAGLIARALEVARATKGAFDPSYAAVGELWDFKAHPARLPDAASITRALAHVGWQKVRVDLERHRVTLQKGMRLGLGGIAKGYAVDRAMAVLMAAGVEHAIVNAGGDMKVLGERFGEPWEVAIKHPRDRQRAIAVLRVSNVSVVSSGDYERYFEIEGHRYHHILDPRTGMPEEKTESVTVIDPSAELADALATGISVLGPRAGLALVEELDRTEAIVVGSDGRVQASSGLRSALREATSSARERRGKARTASPNGHL